LAGLDENGMKSRRGNTQYSSLGVMLSCRWQAGPNPNGIELKAERRKPSGEKHCDVEDIPSLTGVLPRFRLH
jgi:hypothetical protein